MYVLVLLEPRRPMSSLRGKGVSNQTKFLGLLLLLLLLSQVYNVRKRKSEIRKMSRKRNIFSKGIITDHPTILGTVEVPKTLPTDDKKRIHSQCQ